MIWFSDTDRTYSLLRLYPALFHAKTVLYVGARTDRFDYGDLFSANGAEITIVEAYRPNVDHLLSIAGKGNSIVDVIHADIREPIGGPQWDVVMWWHGPEHVSEEELPVTIRQLEQYALDAVVLGCPWGSYPQNAIGGNEYERHVSELDYPLFEELGYQVECLGRKDYIGSNITAVKKELG